jgi:predicted MFS family arabinose efflux permease
MTATPALGVTRAKQPIVVLAGGILALFVAVGVGRFAFTLLLPLMQKEAGFGARMAGWLAGANHLGYFAGSLTATIWPLARGTRQPLLAAFVVTVLGTAGMGLTGSPAAWLALRFVSGAASAWVFVVVSALVLTRLREAGRAALGGWLYSGVGLGIAATSALVLVLPIRDSATLWLLFAAMCAAVLALSTWFLPAAPAPVSASDAAAAAQTPHPGSARALLLTAYSLEGIGYIVSATFIVSVIHAAQGRFEAGAWAWMVVGLAGIPACVLWTRHSDALGLPRRLASAYWIQAAGIAAIALAPASLPIALVSAATLGATLTGTVLLTMALAPVMDPEHPRRMIGQLTIGFSIGQMLGPVLAGYAAYAAASYAPALLGSAALVAVSALAMHAMARARRF